MAKVRLVVADQNSAEVQALTRSFNSLLLILENAFALEAAGTTTSIQTAAGLANAFSSGRDSNVTPYVGTQRLIYGIRATPTHPQRRAEILTDLQPMISADSF